MSADDVAGSAAPPRIREAVRALVVDPQRRVLLVRFEFPDGQVWAAPGGGMEPGETAEAALRRELGEELGLVEFELGPHIWDRTHIIPFINGMFDGQHDRFFLIETEAFEPAPTLTWEQLNAEYVFEIRWWTADELDKLATTKRLFFAPRRLPGLYRRFLADGVPATPIDTGR